MKESKEITFAVETRPTPLRMLLILVGCLLAIGVGFAVLRVQGNGNTGPFSFFMFSFVGTGAVMLFAIAGWVISTRLMRLAVIPHLVLLFVFVLTLMFVAAYQNTAWREAQLSRADVVETNVWVSSVYSETYGRGARRTCAQLVTNDPRLPHEVKWCGGNTKALWVYREARFRFVPERPDVNELVLLPYDG